MNETLKFFDKVSSKSNPQPNKTASKIIESSKEFLGKENYVLDFGCGSGSITNKLSKVAKFIDAIDISSGMLDFAKKQAEKDSIEISIIYRLPYLINDLRMKNMMRFWLLMFCTILKTCQDLLKE